ncbi:NAD(P)-dependent oxidoreductase, partial [Helicobacter typhlonius]|uniref:NAD(P)-dependent oxidoreductase n=1 Tax=Helicobacter typhlonius TaxID=76936 RepID=UPI002FE23FEC
YLCENEAEVVEKVISCGSIGQRVAHLARAFDAQVSYYSTSGKNTQSDYERKSLESLLSGSDIISIHAPLNPQTKNLLNRTNLHLLKDGALLINVGRGGIVNEEDIAEILKSKDMYFGADVLETEPMRVNHPFLNPSITHKLLLTPHTAWAYDKARERLIALTAKNIQDYVEQKNL